MQRTSRLPLLILGLLTVLAVGAAVLALVEAPTTPDLTVHNGVGETASASSLTFVYSSKSPDETVRVAFRAPDQATESLLEGGPAGKPVRTVTLQGARATQVLQIFDEVAKVSGFSARGGSTYVATRPYATLVPPDEANEVSGTVRYTATVHGGYLVRLIEQYDVKVPGGAESGTDHFEITHIGGQKVAAA